MTANGWLDRAEASSMPAGARDPFVMTPATAAIAYPFLLRGFHAAIGAAGGTGFAHGLLAWPLLLGAFLAPGLGMLFAFRSAGLEHPTSFQLRARLLAYLSLASPPLYIFASFLLSILGQPLPESVAWVVAWSAFATWVWTARGAEAPGASSPPGTKARVAHGFIAALLVVYVFFHLTNHLFGLIGPDAHAAVMKLGRKVYRAPAIEPVLVALLLTQVGLGAWLAWRWSRLRIDRYRVFQVASGVYLLFFILTHMNSALVAARALQGIDTAWDWASGAPTGLIHDDWSIRLVPHYALGVFFVLSHLASGLRAVLIAHGVRASVANRAWTLGVVCAAMVSAAIIGGLCRIRIHLG